MALISETSSPNRWSIRLVAMALLLACGALWGAVPMLSKLGGGDGSHAISLSLWVNAAGAVVTALLCVAHGQLLWPTRAEWTFMTIWALLYAALNQVIVYWLATKLNASTVSAFTVLEGLMIFAASGLLGLEKPGLLRCAGLLIGFAGAALLVWSPSSIEMTHALMLVGLLVPLSYAAESVFMAAGKPATLSPLFAMFGVMLCATPILAAMGWLTGDTAIPQFPPGPLEWSACAIMCATITANLLYFRLLDMAGPVFAGQLCYLTALCGIGWGVVVLAEKPPLALWFALALMLCGLAIVKPREETKLEIDSI